MKEDHRRKALEALAQFRQEVREAGFSEDELTDIIGHVVSLEDEMKSPQPDKAAMRESTEALENITHQPEVVDAITKVVNFFSSIGIR